GRDAAVVEVDEAAVESEGLLDLAPIVLVGGHLRGRPAGDGAAGGEDGADRARAEGSEHARAPRQTAQEAAPCRHGSLFIHWPPTLSLPTEGEGRAAARLPRRGADCSASYTRPVHARPRPPARAVRRH